MIIILTILFLILLVLVHELGHFLAAKSFKLRVEEFGIGFPPRLWMKKIGETAYSFNLFPLGGFVKILGENPLEAERIPPEERERSFQHQPPWRRSLILLGGVGMNFIAGWLIISSVFFIGIPPGVAVSAVMPASPAETAGFAVNDLIVKVRIGERVLEPTTPEEFVDFIKEFPGQQLSFELKRGGKSLELRAVPRKDAPEGEGALGITVVQSGIEKRRLFAAIFEGLKTSAAIVSFIFVSLIRLIGSAFGGEASLENIMGPIGIFGVALSAGQAGIVYLLQLIGLISLNLMVINLIPLAPFDGGKLLFVFIEKIRGAALSPKVEQTISAIGIALIIPLVIIVFVRDIIRIF